MMNQKSFAATPSSPPPIWSLIRKQAALGPPVQHWANYRPLLAMYSTACSVIAALTSRANLLHDNAHSEGLREQVESLAKELNGERKSGAAQ